MFHQHATKFPGARETSVVGKQARNNKRLAGWLVGHGYWKKKKKSAKHHENGSVLAYDDSCLIYVKIFQIRMAVVVVVLKALEVKLMYFVYMKNARQQKINHIFWHGPRGAERPPPPRGTPRSGPLTTVVFACNGSSKLSKRLGPEKRATTCLNQQPLPGYYPVDLRASSSRNSSTHSNGYHIILYNREQGVRRRSSTAV